MLLKKSIAYPKDTEYAKIFVNNLHNSLELIVSSLILEFKATRVWIRWPKERVRKKFRVGSERATLHRYV